MSEDGPLPQWRQIGGFGSKTFEATDPSGMVWRLWREPKDDTPSGPPRYRLAPVSDLHNFQQLKHERGALYNVLDIAGLRISAGAVRTDPEGARRQLGLDDAE